MKTKKEFIAERQAEALANDRQRARLKPLLGKKVRISKGIGKLLRFVGKGPNCFVRIGEPIPGNVCSHMAWLWPMSEVEPVSQRCKIRYFKRGK